MVTISFQTNDADAMKLFSMLQAYGVDNLTKKEEISEKHQKILDDRLKLHNENPNSGQDYKQVMKSVKEKYGF